MATLKYKDPVLGWQTLAIDGGVTDVQIIPADYGESPSARITAGTLYITWPADLQLDSTLSSASAAAPADKVGEIKSDLTVTKAMLAPTYSASATYAVGDHVTYNGGYYVCNTTISTAEAWTAAHWTQVTVGGETADLKSATDALMDNQITVESGPSPIVSISDGAVFPALDLTIGIEPVQSGSGDPSPDNVRPITGWTGANVVVSPTTDAQDGTTYPISWQSEAGTVYGGTLDVTTGVLTVDRAIVDLGTLTWVSSTSYTHCVLSNSIASLIEDRIGSLCSKYPIIQTSSTSSAITNAPDYTMLINKGVNTTGNFSKGAVILKDSSLDGYTKQQIATALTGVQLVYKLSTPITYQLTPTEVTLLLGGNNILADTGDSTLTYIADTKQYIEQLTKPTEDDMVANSNIPSGKYFMVGNSLYISTAAIAQGAAITPGTNCTALSLADALNTISQ